MSFWELSGASEHLLVIDEATVAPGPATTSRASQHVSVFCFQLANSVIFCSNTPECLAAYVGSLQARVPVALFSGCLVPEMVANLLAVYRPKWLFAPATMATFPSYRPSEFGLNHFLWIDEAAEEYTISPELAVLLSTSGSTGSPKLVRFLL